MESILVDIDKAESRIGSKLRLDFSKEITVFERGLNTLMICVNQEMLGRPAKVKDIATKDFAELGPEDTRFLACWALLGEATLRLQASRRLLLLGYISRALACVRDALEAAMCADICAKDHRKAVLWLIKGKQVKLSSGFAFHRVLNWEVWTIASSTLNTLGTHAYFDATYLSALPQLATLLPTSGEHQRAYRKGVSLVLSQMLRRCFQFLCYVEDCFPEVVAKVPDMRTVIGELEAALKQEIKQVPTTAETESG